MEKNALAGVMPMLQREFLGEASVLMPSSIDVNGVRYMYIYALDDSDRVVEIVEYKMNGESFSDAEFQRVYNVKYVYQK